MIYFATKSHGFRLVTWLKEPSQGASEILKIEMLVKCFFIVYLLLFEPTYFKSIDKNHGTFVAKMHLKNNNEEARISISRQFFSTPYRGLQSWERPIILFLSQYIFIFLVHCARHETHQCRWILRLSGEKRLLLFSELTKILLSK